MRDTGVAATPACPRTRGSLIAVAKAGLLGGGVAAGYLTRGGLLGPTAVLAILVACAQMTLP